MVTNQHCMEDKVNGVCMCILFVSINEKTDHYPRVQSLFLLLLTKFCSGDIISKEATLIIRAITKRGQDHDLSRLKKKTKIRTQACSIPKGELVLVACNASQLLGINNYKIK